MKPVEKPRIGADIRAMRVTEGWTQAQLARRLGVSQQRVAKLEDPDANPTVDTLVAIARIFRRGLVIGFPPQGAS